MLRAFATDSIGQPNCQPRRYYADQLSHTSGYYEFRIGDYEHEER